VLFLQRLTKYLNNPSSTFGFVPDIYRLLGKYNLKIFLHTYASTASFPNKTTWRRNVNQAVHGYVENNHSSNANGESRLVSFISIHSKVKPSILWIFSTMYRHYLQQCRITMKLLAKYFSRQYCTKCRTCSNETNEIVLHTTMYCREHLCTTQLKVRILKR